MLARHSRSAARWLYLVFSVLTLLLVHISHCFLGRGGQKQQLVLPPPQPRQHGPSSQQNNSLHDIIGATAMSRSSTRTRGHASTQLNQSDNNKGNNGKEQQDQEVVVDATNNAESSTDVITKSVLFVEPLDMMLARARKRPINPLVKVQGFLDTRINIGLLHVPWLSYGDAVFSLVAISIGAKGFAVGLFMGKWTAASLLALFPVKTRQRIPPILVQLYPVILAILLDQWSFS
jgi:hypothetical protein